MQKASGSTQDQHNKSIITEHPEVHKSQNGGDENNQVNVHMYVKEFENTKAGIRIRKPEKNMYRQKGKVQTKKQRSTKHTHKTKDRVT